MRDPHVVALRYRLECDETLSFENPPLAEAQTDAFRVSLHDDRLTAEMIEHYSTEEGARKRVETYLRSWEVDAALCSGRQEFRFQFESADVIDRDPPPPGSPQTVHVKGIASTVTFGTVTVHKKTRVYPAPPVGFVASPDVETLWARYEGYLQGQEPLSSMAYACLTFLEALAGGRKETARQYNISQIVLGTLGRLSNELGDSQTARKFSRSRSPRLASGSEIAWMETAVKALIRRVGEHASDPTEQRPMLTMHDLPAP